MSLHAHRVTLRKRYIEIHAERSLFANAFLTSFPFWIFVFVPNICYDTTIRFHRSSVDIFFLFYYHSRIALILTVYKLSWDIYNLYIFVSVCTCVYVIDERKNTFVSICIPAKITCRKCIYFSRYNYIFLWDRLILRFIKLNKTEIFL